MKHRNRHAGGRNRQIFSPEGTAAGAPPRADRRHGRGGGHRGGPRKLFDHGDIRLFILSLIAKKPASGYELIQTIEEKSGGRYAPSPGAIYPTLTWLEEARHVRSTEEEGRKIYRITPEGEAFLAANSETLAEIATRSAPSGQRGRKDIPAPVRQAMENLRTALRLRLGNGSPDPEAEGKVAALVEETARAIGQS